MIKLKHLINENISVGGKTYISIDIQKVYGANIKYFLNDYVQFLNENFDSFQNLIFLYNGESMGYDNEEEYKYWWSEGGLNDEILDYAKFYDKGYAFFRYCMDSGIDESATVNFVRFMYQNDIRDSRDMTREMWAKYLREHRKTDRKEVYELLKCSGDCVNIPDLMDYLKSFRNIILTGGAVNECLKEVEIALQALKISYDIDHRFTY